MLMRTMLQQQDNGVVEEAHVACRLFGKHEAARLRCRDQVGPNILVACPRCRSAGLPTSSAVCLAGTLRADALLLPLLLGDQACPELSPVQAGWRRLRLRVVAGSARPVGPLPAFGTSLIVLSASYRHQCCCRIEFSINASLFLRQGVTESGPQSGPGINRVEVKRTVFAIGLVAVSQEMHGRPLRACSCR